MIEAFKNKNCNNYNKDLLKSLSIDILYKNKKNNFNESNINLMNKINSEYSISDHLNDKNEDKKKIISDNSIDNRSFSNFLILSFFSASCISFSFSSSSFKKEQQSS